MEAPHSGLSPEGLTNPKSASAAAKLQASASSSHLTNVGGVDVMLPPKPEPPGPEGTIR